MDQAGRAHYSVMEKLRNGSPVRLRSIRPEDKPGLQDGMDRMSPNSIYKRFHGVKKHLTDRELQYFTEIDFDSHVALVAEVEDASDWLIVGAARYVIVDREPLLIAEVAFAVADDYHRQGIGTLLLEHLISIARDEGIDEFMALVLKENKGMLQVFANSGLPQSSRRQGAAIQLNLPLDSPSDTPSETVHT